MSNPLVSEYCVPNDGDYCMFCGEDMSNEN
jgi:hypothetical protein